MTRLLDARDLDVAQKRVLVREDFNIPIVDGCITDNSRLLAAIPTLKWLLAQKAKIIVVAHLGRPGVGDFSSENSLELVRAYLQETLHVRVELEKNLEKVVPETEKIVLLENIRLYEGEEENSSVLGKKLASLCDIFVFDAFACAHRAQASTYSVAEFAKIAAAGPLLIEEVSALEKAFKAPKRPLLSIIGGAKVSTKVGVIEYLIEMSDEIIIGGGMANTFLAASGVDCKRSLVEANKIDLAKQLLKKAQNKNIKIHLPVDAIVAESLIASTCRTVDIRAMQEQEAIFDIGPQTIKNYVQIIQNASTILWNGPVGVFEQSAYAKGTQVLGQAIANSQAFSVAGGGDTLAAINKFELSGFDLISTGGGAFLEWLEGKTLPAIEILQKRAQS